MSELKNPADENGNEKKDEAKPRLQIKPVKGDPDFQLKISPESEIRLKWSTDSGSASGEVRITNTSGKRQFVKVKITGPNVFTLHPSWTFLEADKTMHTKVGLVDPRSQPEKNRHWAAVYHTASKDKTYAEANKKQFDGIRRLAIGFDLDNYREPDAPANADAAGQSAKNEPT